MDEREMIARRLAQAEEHVLLGEENIARQKEIVAELERDGHKDALHNACALLATFERAQLSETDRDRLRAELAALGRREKGSAERLERYFLMIIAVGSLVVLVISLYGMFLLD
jgi:hypothetical protein